MKEILGRCLALTNEALPATSTAIATAQRDATSVPSKFGAGPPTLIDFDGDGLSDIGVDRNGVWFIRRSLDGGITSVGWGGVPQDKPLPADYDGDGKFDIAVYRNGVWFILRSSDGRLRPQLTGWSPINGCASTGRL